MEHRKGSELARRVVILTKMGSRKMQEDRMKGIILILFSNKRSNSNSQLYRDNNN